jgi:hypothetical protein
MAAGNQVTGRRSEASAAPGQLSARSPAHRAAAGVAAILLVVLLDAGCGSATDHPSGPPVTLRDCGESAYFGGPDGGVVAGLDWPSGHWALGTPTQAYLCVGGFVGSVVSLAQVGSRLTVRPSQSTISTRDAVLPVTITATATGRTTLRLLKVSPSGKPEVQRTVALVVADSERWHFEHAD